MGMVPPSLRAFLAGNSGSGKSVRAWNLYLRHFPRRLLVDLTGEWAGTAGETADTVGGAVDAIRRASSSGRWTVALALNFGDLAELVAWLIPVPALDRSPVRLMGGAVILVDEVDLLAPPGTASEAVRTLYRRSRHVGLSVVSTTQRPANVSREVSAQSTAALALHLSEPRDVAYMSDLMRWDVRLSLRWRDWTRHYPHGGLWADLRRDLRLWLPDAGPPVANPASEDAGLPARAADRSRARVSPPDR